MTTTDGSAKFKITDMRTHHALGEIVALVTTPPDYEHLLLCDGQTISAEDYPELVAALGSNVLPNLNGRVLQGGSTAGEYKEAGLPNITGWIINRIGTEPDDIALWVDVNVGGAFRYTAPYFKNYPRCERGEIGKANYMQGIEFYASDSNPIYGNSATVQPPAYTVRYYICYG